MMQRTRSRLAALSVLLVPFRARAAVLRGSEKVHVVSQKNGDRCPNRARTAFTLSYRSRRAWNLKNTVVSSIPTFWHIFLAGRTFPCIACYDEDPSHQC